MQEGEYECVVIDAGIDENKDGKAYAWLSIQPEDGMEVVVTGKLTTYAARSKYQLIIESMELAGEGARLLVALAERVEVRHDPEITARGSKSRHMVRVELHLKNGRRMIRTLEAPRGSEHKFASQDDVVEKFEKLASHALPALQVEALREAVLNLEKLEDARLIARLLVQHQPERLAP